MELKSFDLFSSLFVSRLFCGLEINSLFDTEAALKGGLHLEEFAQPVRFFHALRILELEAGSQNLVVSLHLSSLV